MLQSRLNARYLVYLLCILTFTLSAQNQTKSKFQLGLQYNIGFGANAKSGNKSFIADAFAPSFRVGLSGIYQFDPELSTAIPFLKSGITYASRGGYFDVGTTYTKIRTMSTDIDLTLNLKLIKKANSIVTIGVGPNLGILIDQKVESTSSIVGVSKAKSRLGGVSEFLVYYPQKYYFGIKVFYESTDYPIVEGTIVFGVNFSFFKRKS